MDAIELCPFSESPLFSRLLINTLFLSVYSLIVGFPIPIILALSLNQLRMGMFKNSVQMISYAPYFISTVVMVGLILQFLDMRRGPINLMLLAIGLQPVHFMGIADYFLDLCLDGRLAEYWFWHDHLSGGALDHRPGPA